MNKNNKNSQPDLKESEIFSEEEMFEIMDSLTENKNIDDSFILNIEDDYFEDEINIENIKENVSKKTFEKLGIKRYSSKNSDIPTKKRFYKTTTFRKITVAAASLAIIFTIFTSDYVTATIKKLFQYIPGINATIQDEGEKFILNKTTKISKDGSYIKLLSVVVDTKSQIISVSLRGNNKECKKVSVRFKNGEEYNLPTSSVASGGDEWAGDYFYNSRFIQDKRANFTYNENDEISIIFNDKENMALTVKLVKASSYQSYEELGPTVSKNGLTITAIPVIEGNELKVNLLTPNIDNQGVEEYCLRPDFNGDNDEYRYTGLLAEKITLKDKKGNIINGRGLNSYAPPLSEFYFKVSDSKDKVFKLTIPYIRMKYNVDKDVKIKLPKIGEKLEYKNTIVDLRGYKLNITSVERPEKNRVLVNIDTNYNAQKEESMFDIELGVKFPPLGDPVYNGWGALCTQTDEKIIGPMSQLDIQLEKVNIDEFDLNIKSIITIKKGPWEFDINLDKLSK